MLVHKRSVWQALKNATLFTRQKSWNGGECRVTFGGLFVEVAASDNFIGVVTQIPYSAKPSTGCVGLQRFLSVKELKELEGKLRDSDDEDFTFVPDFGSVKPAEPEWWEGFDNLMDGAKGASSTPVSFWDCNPERLSMLARLEPKGEHALNWKSIEVDDHQLWWIEYGLATYGVVVPLESEVE